MAEQQQLYGVAQVGGCVSDHVAQVHPWERAVEAERKEHDGEVFVESGNNHSLLESFEEGLLPLRRRIPAQQLHHLRNELKDTTADRFPIFVDMQFGLLYVSLDDFEDAAE